MRAASRRAAWQECLDRHSFALRALLHISDVHFGPPHLAERAARRCSRSSRDRRPTWSSSRAISRSAPSPEQFREARRFVDTIPVPDPRRCRATTTCRMYRVWERVFDRRSAPTAGIVQPELEPVYRRRRAADRRHQHRVQLDAQGGAHQARAPARGAGRCSTQAPGDRCSRWSVAHHHLIPPPELRDASGCSPIAYEAIDLFSHRRRRPDPLGPPPPGLHRQLRGVLPQGSRRPVVILHSGTTTSNRGRGRRARAQHLQLDRDRCPRGSGLVLPLRSRGFRVPAPPPSVPSRVARPRRAPRWPPAPEGERERRAREPGAFEPSASERRGPLRHAAPPGPRQRARGRRALDRPRAAGLDRDLVPRRRRATNGGRTAASAHFLEHMMFKGSARFGPGEIDR